MLADGNMISVIYKTALISIKSSPSLLEPSPTTILNTVDKKATTKNHQ